MIVDTNGDFVGLDLTCNLRFNALMTNLTIAQNASLRPITDIAEIAGLQNEDYEPLGYYKAKFSQSAISRFVQNPKAKMILVTAVSPTPSGEGKTTVTVGLAQGLRRIGKNALPAIREPALGPIFGIKGGACGGGYSQVLPMEDINLFFTGDFPAISSAHNLLSALLDAHLQHGNQLDIATRGDLWPRTMDMNDRALRDIVVGLGGRKNGVVREDGFVITPASEIMAILCLSDSFANLKERLGNIVVGQDRKREPIFARDLRAPGAMAALLTTAIRPNLVQTMEGGPALVHGGPFGNIAHGCSSILGTKTALGLADFVVTEAGFGSDLGAEKFLNIVCSRLGFGPDAIVLVATIRALMHQGEGDLSVGFANLEQHLRHLQSYGPPIVVAINRRAEDNDADHATLIDLCERFGVRAVTCDPWNAGGRGCEDLAMEVECISGQKANFQQAYQASDSIEEKLMKITQKVYGGSMVELSDQAKGKADWLRKHGFGQISVCVAKTQYSLSDDPTKLNAPKDHTLHIRDIKLSAGAGFMVAVAGDIMLMPGLGKDPTAFHIDVDENGRISGLF